MTQKTHKTVKSLELIPATSALSGALAMISESDDLGIPKNATKLTLPALLKPDQIPVGGVVNGRVVAVVGSISSRPDMGESRLLSMHHVASGTDFLLPLTGTIKRAVGGFEGAEKLVGKTLYVRRLEDGTTTKYSGKNEAAKKVYMFDVFVTD